MDNNYSKRYQYVIASIGTLMGTSLGLVLGWSSPIIPKLQDPSLIYENPLNRVLTDEEASNVASFLNLGAILGPVIAMCFSDRYGRKITLTISGTLITICSIALIFLTNLELICTCRFLIGIGVGAAYMVYPMYMGEISSVDIRGLVLCLFCFSTSLGFLFVYTIGPYTSYKTCASIISIIPCAFVILFQFLAPESPFFLLSKGKRIETEEVLMKLRTKTDAVIKNEIKNIEGLISAKNEKLQILQLFTKRGLRRALLTTLSLILCQQITGINIILFYSQTIFQISGSNIAPEICTIILGVVQLAASSVTPIVVEIFGRRKMLIASGLGVVLSDGILGTIFFLNFQNINIDSIAWMPILCLIVFMIFYNFGLGPIPWTIMGEVFDNKWKSVASMITVCFCFTMGFTLLKWFSTISAVIGTYGIFWFFAGCTALITTFLYFYLIETKGKSFQEIQDILNGKTDT